MKDNQIVLTKSELELMEILWQAGRPVAKPEVVKLSEQCPWNENYIHRLLNSLLSKKAIRIVGKVQLSNKYSRLFFPTFSANEYAAMQIKNRATFRQEDIPELVVAMFEGKKNQKVIEELEQILEEMKGSK